MKNFLEKHFITVAILIVGTLLLTGVGLTFYNQQIMQDALDLQRQSELVKSELDDVYTNIRQMDVSSRGYAITKENNFLFYSIEQARQDDRTAFVKLDSLLKVQGYNDAENYANVKKGKTTYVNLYEEMVIAIRSGNWEHYMVLLRKDYGKDFWFIYDKFASKLFSYETTLKQKAEARYKSASFRNSLVQSLIFLLGIPMIIILVIRLKKEEKIRTALLLDLEANNRKYLFDPGIESSKDGKTILAGSIENLQKAADFVSQIANGDYEVQWQGLDQKNESLNTENLVGKLIRMREEMKRVKQEDEKRLWVTEGLSKFSDIIRSHQHNLEELTFQSLIFLVKYLKAQQGALFTVAQDDRTKEEYLEMKSCYAFERKKYIQKRIEFGEGIIGQAYLEGETKILTQVPEKFVHITSGLGEALPRCIVVIPMKSNEEVRAIIELASFRKFQQHEISFIEKAGEFIASAVTTAETNEKTRRLLSQSQAQAQQLREQEEELRQNMEELEATQEVMKRKELDLEKRIKENLN